MPIYKARKKIFIVQFKSHAPLFAKSFRLGRPWKEEVENSTFLLVVAQ